MSTYQTEEEQVEALKKWWKENGKSVIGGVVLGLAVIGGGKGWMEYKRVNAENASLGFEHFLQAAQEEDLQTALKRGESVKKEYGSSTYAALTALEMAHLQYQAGDKEKAKTNLQWVVDHAEPDALDRLTRIRMARLFLDLNALDEAAKLVSKVEAGAYQGEMMAIKAEVALARGKKDAARAAFKTALEKGVSNPALVRMQLAELGG